MNYNEVIPAALVGSLLLLSGCSTTAKSTGAQPEAVKDQAKAVQTEQYYPVQTTGSWIPRKVKKKEDIVGNGVVAVEGAALEQAVDAGRSRQPRDASVTPGR